MITKEQQEEFEKINKKFVTAYQEATVVANDFLVFLNKNPEIASTVLGILIYIAKQQIATFNIANTEIAYINKCKKEIEAKQLADKAVAIEKATENEQVVEVKKESEPEAID